MPRLGQLSGVAYRLRKTGGPEFRSTGSSEGRSGATRTRGDPAIPRGFFVSRFQSSGSLGFRSSGPPGLWSSGTPALRTSSRPQQSHPFRKLPHDIRDAEYRGQHRGPEPDGPCRFRGASGCLHGDGPSSKQLCSSGWDGTMVRWDQERVYGGLSSSNETRPAVPPASHVVRPLARLSDRRSTGCSFR